MNNYRLILIAITTCATTTAADLYRAYPTQQMINAYSHAHIDSVLLANLTLLVRINHMARTFAQTNIIHKAQIGVDFASHMPTIIYNKKRFIRLLKLLHETTRKLIPLAEKNSTQATDLQEIATRANIIIRDLDNILSLSELTKIEYKMAEISHQLKHIFTIIENDNDLLYAYKSVLTDKRLTPAITRIKKRAPKLIDKLRNEQALLMRFWPEPLPQITRGPQKKRGFLKKVAHVVRDAIWAEPNNTMYPNRNYPQYPPKYF